MTQYFQTAYTFNGQISYSREEIDKRLSLKAAAAQVYNRIEIDERFGSTNSSIVTVSAKLDQLIADVLAGNVPPPSGTVIDGLTTTIRLNRLAVAYERPLPANIDLGEVVVGYDENSPFLYIEDGAGVIRRICGVQFGTTLPNGTLYVQGMPSTYPEQRTRGERFYNPVSGIYYIFDGSAWRIVSYGTDVVRPSTLATVAETNLSIYNLSDVTAAALADNHVLTWEASSTQFKPKAPLVTSVASKQGVVLLLSDDIDDSASLTKKFLTPAQVTKLDGIETAATADQTAEEIRDALETLTGLNRLDASAIKNLSAASIGAVTSVNGYTGVVTLVVSDIADDTSEGYVSTVINNKNELINGGVAGAVEVISPPTEASNLRYDVGTDEIIWERSNVRTLDRETLSANKNVTAEFNFLNPGGSTYDVILPSGGGLAIGQYHFVKNIDAGVGVLDIPALGSFSLDPGEQVGVIWDGVEWQIV